MHSHQKFREHHASRRRVAHLLKSESGRAPAKAGGGAVGNRMKGALSAPDSADVMTEGSARPKRMAKPKGAANGQHRDRASSSTASDDGTADRRSADGCSDVGAGAPVMPPPGLPVRAQGGRTKAGAATGISRVAEYERLRGEGR
jgi:hypothetical protein